MSSPRPFLTVQFAELIHGPEGVSVNDPAEACHEASRLYPSLAPERLDTLTELAQGTVLQATLERATRAHLHRPQVLLPEPRPLCRALDDAIGRRRSRLSERSLPLAMRDLATVLARSYRAEGDRELRRPVPSAGALYPLELYVLALDVSELEQAVYHYEPYHGQLSLLAPLTPGSAREAVIDPDLVDSTAAIIVVTGMFWRSRVKYGVRGYRFALLEAGHLIQNAVLVASALDLPALPLGGFYDRRVDELVGADSVEEASLHLLLIGGSA